MSRSRLINWFGLKNRLNQNKFDSFHRPEELQLGFEKAKRRVNSDIEHPQCWRFARHS